MRLKPLLACVLALTLLAPACHRGGGAPSAAPLLEKARLSGSFLINLTIVKQAGLLKPISGGAAIWTFKPACKTGPCRVLWTVSLNKSRAHLKRTGVSYSGKARTPANIRNCKGASNKEMVVLHIRVTDAADSNGTLTATKIAGTMSEENKAPGCKLSRANWKISGSIQK